MPACIYVQGPEWTMLPRSLTEPLGEGKIHSKRTWALGPGLSVTLDTGVMASKCAHSSTGLCAWQDRRPAGKGCQGLVGRAPGAQDACPESLSFVISYI